MINIVATLLQTMQAKKEKEVKQSFYPLHEGHRTSRFFIPDRNYPFIVTFLYGVINLKRICKKVKENFRKKRKQRGTQFQLILRNSTSLTNRASKGLPHPAITFESGRASSDSLHLKSDRMVKGSVDKTRRPINSMIRQAEKYLVESQSKQRGKGLSSVNRLKKSLASMDANFETNQRAKQEEEENNKKVSRRDHIASKDAEAILANNEAYRKIAEETAAKLNATEDGSDEDEVSIRREGRQKMKNGDFYLPGTVIYYGATIALQARHGGFLSYKTNDVKASAQKIFAHTCYVAKNTADITDVREIKYGDALWLQTPQGTDVLGASYGSLVQSLSTAKDGSTSKAKKRLIQPALIKYSKERGASMFKAKQYGRWVILNREDPMATLGKQVLNHDKIMLEQEWYFLASSTPTNSMMYKSIDNSDDAMTTKIDLFKPSEDCIWRVHIVQLPAYDNANERERVQQLMRAEENIEMSKEGRKNKRRLWAPLKDQLSPELREETVVSKKLQHKVTLAGDNMNMKRVYEKIQARGFRADQSSINFLSYIYGENSKIIQHELETRAIRSGGAALGARASCPDEEDDYDRPGPLRRFGTEMQRTIALDRAHDTYWKNAQPLLLDSKGWAEMTTAMTKYYKADRISKSNAATIIQKCVRRYLENKFNFKRAFVMKDKGLQRKIQDKIIARKKLMEEHSKAATASMKPETDVIASSANSRRVSMAHSCRSLIRKSPGGVGSVVHREKSQGEIIGEIVATTVYPVVNASVQSILTDSLINSHGTPHVDINSKDVMITSRNSSAIVQDMHRRMVSIARSPKRSDAAKESNLSGGSVFVTSMCNSNTAVLPHVQENDPPIRNSLQRPLSSPSAHGARHRGLEASMSTPSLRGNFLDDGISTEKRLRPHTALAALQTHTLEPIRSEIEIEKYPYSLMDDKTAEVRHSHLNEGKDDTKHSTKLEVMQASQKQWSDRLSRTADRDYGLPADVFDWQEDACLATAKVGVDTGIKFLRAMASDPSIYEDVRGSRRRRQTGRPKTASSLLGNDRMRDQSWLPGNDDLF